MIKMSSVREWNTKPDMRFPKIIAIAAFWLILSSSISASETVTNEPNSSSYNFVSHYDIRIDAPAEQVWTHLVNLGSWMFKFEMSHYSGEQGAIGEVIRLYSDQDFFVQTTGLIPNKLLAMANLPFTFKGEYSAGNSVTTLSEFDGGTIVNLTMIRRYTWKGEGENPLMKTRESEEFQKNTRATWQAFLARLNELVMSDLETRATTTAPQT